MCVMVYIMYACWDDDCEVWELPRVWLGLGWKKVVFFFQNVD